MGYIYLVTNKINGKQYIGQTQQMDIEKRWSDHKRENPAVGSYLYAAYKKYGIDKFKFQIICICFDEDCNSYEEEYIKKFNTLRPNGYNLKPGGNNSKLSEESRDFISQRVRESMTPEVRKKISEGQKGKKISEEQKQKISIKHKEFWQNMTPEERNHQIQKIRKNIPSDVKLTEPVRRALQKGADSLKKRVGKFNDEGKLLESFESVSEASDKTTISRVGISKVCLQKTYYHKAGGFIWKFI